MLYSHKMAQLHRYKRLHSSFKKSSLQTSPGKQEGCRFDSSPALLCVASLKATWVYVVNECPGLPQRNSESLTHTTHTQSSWLC